MEKLNENFVGLYKRWSGGRIREEDINRIINELRIDKYTINKDYTVDVNGDVIIRDKHLINGKLPIKFGNVSGDFDCSSCGNLTSLEGSPNKVGGDFDCYECPNLLSLKGAPEKVGRDFDCSYCNKIKTLGGAPKEVGINFECYKCYSLKSLKGAPKEIGGDFNCGNCINLPDSEVKKLIDKGVHVVY